MGKKKALKEKIQNLKLQLENQQKINTDSKELYYQEKLELVMNTLQQLGDVEHIFETENTCENTLYKLTLVLKYAKN